MVLVNLPVPSSIVILMVIMFCATQILNSARRLFTIQPPGVPMNSILIGAAINLTVLFIWICILVLFVNNL